MAEEENVELARRSYEEAWVPLDVEALGRFYAEDFIDHNPMSPEGSGLQRLKGEAAMLRAAFPNGFQMTIDLLFAHEDFVVGRWTAQAHNTGPLMGMPATGKHGTMTGIDINRIANGKIVEVWHLEDVFGMMQQLGVIPAPGQAPS
jgi:predicted ester cyclase